MATAIARPPQPIARSTTPPSYNPPLTLNTTRTGPAPVPNKHLQPLSPGCTTATDLGTPPPTPSRQLSIQTSSILHPPDPFPKIFKSPSIHVIDAEELAAALGHLASQPSPEPKQVFPWLHGLHPENHVQVAFFTARRKSMRRPPKCLRGITIVKAGGDLSRARLKGAIAPTEILPPGEGIDSTFSEVDPQEGFSVRNFQIQVGKLATVSDVVVYGDESTNSGQVYRLAKRIASAQAHWQFLNSPADRNNASQFNTFVVKSPFSVFEESYPELVALNANGEATGQVMDFFQSERLEMYAMSGSSEIAPNVYLGPTPDVDLDWDTADTPGKLQYDVLVEASDLAQVPEPQILARAADVLELTGEPQTLEIPSSGSVMPTNWSPDEVDGLIETCRWISKMAHPLGAEPDCEPDQDGDLQMIKDVPQPRKVLLHCPDGYTESSLFALIYIMYAEGVPVSEAWMRLHCQKQRNFFAYPSDVALLKNIQSRILQQSPCGKQMKGLSEPGWLSRMDGSLPSRILPYMYLGNLCHANNPGLLRALGIGQVLGVGEAISWSHEEQESWGEDNLMLVDRVQDNGVDPLTDVFGRCLEFIKRGKEKNTATLVHCRVGVSRSATICIAEVMNARDLSFPRAYCFVRARRLNVIIQPHLRFSYELLKWEEYQQAKRRRPIKRELEWASIAREIALMNRPYSR
ncbi:MAG: tyrosine/serine/threonine protein phosphatase pps1 [Piccolia ochrophora]|nr:MAG: tyrosine/serine/threonine protein phosphatase pps1 [Piccolia ochrophora]